MWVALLLVACITPAFAEKTAAPVADLAYGAYQRGDYKTAMTEAQRRVAANAQDAAALAL
ncbi:MAG: sel1 repeat family protein, partial [Methylocystis sp.]|nr:sel1 repeat family protein [Methylocystis sp.]